MEKLDVTVTFKNWRRSFVCPDEWVGSFCGNVTRNIEPSSLLVQSPNLKNLCAYLPGIKSPIVFIDLPEIELLLRSNNI